MKLGLILLCILAAAGAVANRRRIRDYIGGRGGLDDDMVRRIEQEGTLELEDPTDLEEVRREEERFWSETWDVPDED